MKRCEHTAQNGDLVHAFVASSLSVTLQEEIHIINENAGGEKVFHLQMRHIDTFLGE